MRESNTRFSLSHITLKTGQPSYLRSLPLFPSHRCILGLPLITLGRPSLTSRLKIANRSFYQSAPVLWNNLPSHLRQVVHHVTSPISNLPVSDLSTSFFFKKLKTHLFHSSFPPKSVFTYRLSQDWYLRYWPSFVVSSHTYFATIHRHIIQANFYVI